MEKFLPNESNEELLRSHYDGINKTIDLVVNEIKEVGSERTNFYVGNEVNPGYDEININFIEDLNKILEENKSDTHYGEILGLLNRHAQIVEDTKKDRERFQVSGDKMQNLGKIDKDTPIHEIDGMADTIQMLSNTVLNEAESEKEEFNKNIKSIRFIADELYLMRLKMEEKGVLNISETLVNKISSIFYQYLTEMAEQENRLKPLTSDQEELSSVMGSRAASIRNSIPIISHLVLQEN